MLARVLATVGVSGVLKGGWGRMSTFTTDAYGEIEFVGAKSGSSLGQKAHKVCQQPWEQMVCSKGEGARVPYLCWSFLGNESLGGNLKSLMELKIFEKFGEIL